MAEEILTIINKDSNNLIHNVNIKLRKNYFKCLKTNTDGKTKTIKAKLLVKGF